MEAILRFTAFLKQKFTRPTEKVNQELKDDSKKKLPEKIRRKRKDLLLLSLCAYKDKYEHFTSSFGRPHQKNASKSVPHVQHDYFFSSNQLNR